MVAEDDDRFNYGSELAAPAVHIFHGCDRRESFKKSAKIHRTDFGGIFLRSLQLEGSSSCKGALESQKDLQMHHALLLVLLLH